MKTFKIIDFLLQIVLIIVGVVFVFSIDRMELDRLAFLMSYFLIGSWQLFSAIVHLFYKAPYENTMRWLYHFFLVLIIALVIIACFIDSILLFAGEVLLFFSPVMAMYYLVTCFVETKWLINQDNTLAEQASQ